MNNKKQRLEEKYESDVLPKLMSEFGIKNKMEAPKIVKIVVNSGVGGLLKNKEQMEKLAEDMAQITGQKPSVRASRVSVASFGLRRGMPVGLKVTLRKGRMYAFLDRLISVVLPRMRDFRGLPVSAFDAQGNYTFGVSEHNVFPEIDLGKTAPHGLEVTLVLKKSDKKLSQKFLSLMGLPFEKE